MAIRLLDVEVKAILDTEVDTTPFITTAVLLVERYLGTAGLPADQLHEIARWLAAHLACTRDPRFTQVSTDGQSMAFAKTQDYWETVRMLDTTGLLVQALTMKRASIKVD